MRKAHDLRSRFTIRAVGWMLTLVAAVIGALAVHAAARDNGPLTVIMYQYEVVPPHGDIDEEQRVPIAEEAVSPSGTTVEYELVVTNVSDNDVNDLLLALPVPPGTVYVDGSARFDATAALLQFSVDGGDTYRHPPVRYVVREPDGTEVEKTATSHMYTHLRLVFLVPLVPEGEVYVTYRVEVL